MGEGQNININRSLGEANFNLPGRLCGIQDLSGRSNRRCGRNNRARRIRSGTGRCD
jgi:hypothetical protein